MVAANFSIFAPIAHALAVALVVCGVALPVPAASQEPAVPTLAPMLREVTSGVVNIAVRARGPSVNPLFNDPFFRRFFDLPDMPRQPRETSASGSGVVVDARRGYVLTNNHVVAEADAIEVTTKDNQRYPARLVGRDPGTDIAVLQIQGQGFQAVPLGDSDRLQVGDYVVAIGNPFGLGQTVTSGIVSGPDHRARRFQARPDRHDPGRSKVQSALEAGSDTKRVRASTDANAPISGSFDGDDHIRGEGPAAPA